MHPYVKLHKPLRLVHYLIICMMILSPVSSRSCNGGLRTIQLYSQFTRGHVRIEDRRVVAGISINLTDHILQIVPIDRIYFAIYDPNAKMFICWNRNYSNLLPRRNPRDLRYCKFDEKVSIKHPTDLTRYTTTYRTKAGVEREIEMKFNKFGNFGTTKFLRKCLERKKRLKETIYDNSYNNNNSNNFNNNNNISNNQRHHQYYKIDVDLMTNLDTLHLTNETKKAYVQLSKYCADSDFVAQTVSSNCSWSSFCEQMERIHQKHPIACELSSLCQIKDNKRCGNNKQQ